MTQVIEKALAISKLLLNDSYFDTSTEAFDKMYSCWYDPDYGHLITKSDLEYCDVTVEDSPNKDLSAGERVTHHEDIVRPVSRYSNYSTRTHGPVNSTEAPSLVLPSGFRGQARQRLVHLHKGTVINPVDGSVFCQDNAFHVVLHTKFSSSDPQSWVFFSSHSAVVSQEYVKYRPSTSSAGEKQSMAKYRVHLALDADMGHVQFFQAAKHGCKSARMHYPWGSLLNLYLYRSPEASLEKRCYPEIIPIVPSNRQNYVPLLMGQTMQMITPDIFRVGYRPTEGKVQPLHHQLKVGARTGEYVFNYFRCRYPVGPTPELVFFEAKDSPRSGVVIVPAILKRDNDCYAVLHAPQDDCTIFVNNIDGFILRMDNDRMRVRSRRGWLDRAKSLKIESGHVTSIASSNYSAFDLKVRIMDKTRQRVQIKDLFNPDGCTTI